MIKNKELGVVIAENAEEAAWYNVVENLKEEIKMLNLRIKKAEDDMKIDARKIVQKFRNGAKLLIKQHKNTIMVNEEFLQLAQSKIRKA